MKPLSVAEQDVGVGQAAVTAFLRQELIGPAGGEDELLHDPPHRRYLMGTLYPKQTSTAELEELEEQDGSGGSVGEELADDPVTLANEWMPSSIGLSFFVHSQPQITVDVW